MKFVQAWFPDLEKELDDGFMWRTQDGQYLRPADMRTSHLFFALRMLWNHTMPDDLCLPGGRYNNIGILRDKAKSKKAIIQLAIELSKRDLQELHESYLLQFNYMVITARRRESEGFAGVGRIK